MIRFLSFLVVLVFVPGLAIRGETAFTGDQTEESTSKEKTSKQLSERIRKLIRQLDADDFQDRADAEKKLIEIGAPARKGLEKAVQSDPDGTWDVNGLSVGMHN